MSATTSGRGKAASPAASRVEPLDGRRLRWAKHRAQRRSELVDATMRAIRTHGAGVGMDDIAATAGTSKTVFYRHFTDRAGLYSAVTERVDANIMRDVMAASEDGLTGGPEDGRAVLAGAIGSYLRLVEDEPEIYRFVVTAPLLDRSGSGDPSGAVSAHIAEQISLLLSEALGNQEHRGRVWAHGVVGMVRAASDDWLHRGAAESGVSRAELAELLTDLAWSGLSTSWR